MFFSICVGVAWKFGMVDPWEGFVFCLCEIGGDKFPTVFMCYCVPDLWRAYGFVFVLWVKVPPKFFLSLFCLLVLFYRIFLLASSFNRGQTKLSIFFKKETFSFPIYKSIFFP